MRRKQSMLGESIVSQEFITKIFKDEAVKFSGIIASNDFIKGTVLYDEAFNRNAKEADTYIKIPGPLKRKKQLDASQNNKWIKPVLSASQISVCCYLFKGYKYPKDTISDEYMAAIAKEHVTNMVRVHGEKVLKYLSFVLESVEGLRTDKILRGFGLLSLPADKARSLSLGSGSGIKDLEAIFSNVWIQNEQVGQVDLVEFHARQMRAMHTILIDNDIGYRDRYKDLNDLHNGEVLAINKSLDIAMEHISSKVKDGTLLKRNIIIASRMDHVMLPDVNCFFQSVKKVTTETSDLVISIGSGNNIEEFKARLKKLKEIEVYLSSRNLDVYRIKLCKGKSPEEMIKNPLFGYTGHAIYEILFCKIKNKYL